VAATTRDKNLKKRKKKNKMRGKKEFCRKKTDITSTIKNIILENIIKKLIKK